MILVAAVGGTIFGIVVLYFISIFLYQCLLLRKFSGPLALPLLGNCYHPDALFFLRYLVTLRKKFGRTFTFFGFLKPYLVVCDPIVVRRVLSDPSVFIKGSDYTIQFGAAFGSGLVTSNGDKHKKDRSIFNKYFIKSNIAKFTAAIDTLLKVEEKEQKTFNIETFFSSLALRVFMRFSVGTDHSSNPKREREICHIVSEGSWAVGRVVSLGLPMWKIIPWVRMIYEGRDNILNDFRGIVELRKSELKKNPSLPIDDCLSAMLRENMSEKNMADHYVTLICAGHDTTSYFSSYMCYLLGNHPAVQDRLLQEIRDRLPDASKDITVDDVAELKYLNQVMQETLRLYSIIPQLSRYCTEEVSIPDAGITIPKGVNVLIPMFLINRDPELWSDPSEFKPERFEDKGMDFTNAKSGFFPFGYGTRVCIGNTLSQIESAIFMCKLLRKFRFEADPSFRPNIYSGISLTTSNGLNVVLSRRD
mmetsp:Transcript_27996/g.39831  ORF Transcript_27996/g.39831 Transcript_27996/m.39831 type:complete len:475 (-) Transcript_27996:262-1686(-)